MIKKYKEENGWDHPSIGSRFDQLTTVHRMGREQFYSRQRDLAAIKRYKAALKQIEIPDFSFKLSQKLKSHFRIEAAEYIRNHPNYLESNAGDYMDAQNSHPAIQFLKHGKHIRRFVEPVLDELAKEIENETPKGKTNLEAVGYFSAARAFWEEMTHTQLPQTFRADHEFLDFFQDIIDAFEIKARARSVAKTWHSLQSK